MVCVGDFSLLEARSSSFRSVMMPDESRSRLGSGEGDPSLASGDILCYPWDRRPPLWSAPPASRRPTFICQHPSMFPSREPARAVPPIPAPLLLCKGSQLASSRVSSQQQITSCYALSCRQGQWRRQDTRCSRAPFLAKRGRVRRQRVSAGRGCSVLVRHVGMGRACRGKEQGYMHLGKHRRSQQVVCATLG